MSDRKLKTTGNATCTKISSGTLYRAPQEQEKTAGLWIAAVVSVALAVIPLFNLVSFYLAVLSLNLLASESAYSIAATDTVAGAQKKVPDALQKFSNPSMTLFHHVEADPQSAHINILVARPFSKAEVFPISEKLPIEKRPGHAGNENNTYSYELEFNCSVSPLINLSYIPVINRIPMVGCPHTVTMKADALLEHPGALE